MNIQSASVATTLLVAVWASTACGTSDANPFANGDGDSGAQSSSGSGGGSSSGGSGSTSSSGSSGGVASDGGGGADGSSGGGAGIACGTTPTRYIVLGHSVAACYAVGGTTSETCSLKSTETYLAGKFPGLQYENYAVNGALIADVVNTQLPKVTGSTGNVFVNLFIGGNDLAAHLYEPDATATQSWNNLQPAATQNMNTILAYFEDKTKFPGGATILVNSQYNPFDECVTVTNPFATSVKQGILKQFNALLVTIAAGHKSAVVVDQYGDVLGHGDNYNQATSNATPPVACPYYIAGNASWMADLIHPNALGHVALAKQMTNAVDAVFKCQ
jgi:lysophospholipase L1-like esterase